MKTNTSLLLFVILLAACSGRPAKTATSPPIPIDTNTATLTPNPTRTPRPTKTSTPTLEPTQTVPAATSNAIGTTEAIRAKLVSQIPELDEYTAFCHPTYCFGIEVSPNGQWAYFSNGNVLELVEVGVKKLGKYSWYEIYGESHGYPDNYYEGYVGVIHWSNDGRYVYLATRHGDGGPGPYFGYRSALARVNLQNGTWKDTGISGVISFSPNDKYIAYSTNLSEVRVRELQNGEEKIYVTPAYYQFFGRFVWSPDSKKIIFVATPDDFDKLGEKFALFMIDLESNKNIHLYEDSMPFYYPVEWTEDNKVSLHQFNQAGTWTLDLSVTPPTIEP